MREFASGLYVGSIRHRRHQAPVTAFSHSYWQVLIDLDELPELDRSVGLFGHNRHAVLSFDDRDHMGPEARPVRDKLASWMGNRGLTLPDGPVRLLTGLRHFGWGFNPVSFFFCHDADGDVRWVVAEVNNTFGETYPYLLEADGPSGRVRTEEPKVFHVSPFFPVDGAYRFAVALPGQNLSIHIELHRDGEHALDATLTGERRPLTGGALGRALLRHPHQTARTVGLIHWHALKLWLRRARVHTKPAPPVGAWETHHG